MNNLLNISGLKNRYFILRHGESEANVLGIILSDPKNGINSYGLSEKGKLQVRNSCVNNADLDNEIIIFSSDFKRARETAEIAKEIFNVETIGFTDKLRERFFGDFEKTENSNYQSIWDIDKINANHTLNNVESVNSVLRRVTDLIIELEKKYSGKKILLVSHGDALQILQTGFMKMPSSEDRGLKHLETAEIRELILHKNHY